MGLQIASLNSGSNGNCYYVGNDREAVLVDAGLSCRETEKRFKTLRLDPKRVKAIFISHEHGDHIKGVSTFANKYRLPVYITEKTANKGPQLIGHLRKSFTANETIQVGSLQVTAFTKYHDAADPHSFVVSCSGVTVGVITDIGKVCHEVARYFGLCHAVFLESNYDTDMLENGKYPLHLKNRIRGGLGHLSNKEALDLFLRHRSPTLSHLLLSHLSKENNSPELVSDLFNRHAGETQIIIASRYNPTELITVAAGEQGKSPLPRPRQPMQLKLFGQ